MFVKRKMELYFPPSVTIMMVKQLDMCEVMKRFKPTLTVVYLSNVDGCHSNFTSYLQSLHS